MTPSFHECRSFGHFGGILKSAEQHLKQGKTVMFLAACAYMLQPVVAALRKRGIPFHNPYRKSNGFWNPLRIGKKGSSANRILSLLVSHPDFGDGRRSWTYGDLTLWADCLASKGILKDGMKEKIRRYDRAQAATTARLDEIFEMGALTSLTHALEGDYAALLNWWRAGSSLPTFAVASSFRQTLPPRTVHERS